MLTIEVIFSRTVLKNIRFIHSFGLKLERDLLYLSEDR
jgi:hypothetical protein